MDKSNIKKVINSLDSFFNDIKLFIDELRKNMDNKGFKLHPQQGNGISFSEYSVSNSLLNPSQWILKGFQLCFVPKNTIETTLLEKAIFFSISLYSTSAFNYPVLLGWKSSFKQSVNLNDIYYKIWGSKQIWNIDSIDSQWRLVKSDKTVSRSTTDLNIKSIDLIDRINLLFFDLMSISDRKIIEDSVVQPILKIYNEEEIDISSNDIIIKNIPEILIEKWNEGIEINQNSI